VENYQNKKSFLYAYCLFWLLVERESIFFPIASTNQEKRGENNFIASQPNSRLNIQKNNNFPFVGFLYVIFSCGLGNHFLRVSCCCLGHEKWASTSSLLFDVGKQPVPKFFCCHEQSLAKTSICSKVF
jgi:hypothetical protein